VSELRDPLRRGATRGLREAKQQDPLVLQDVKCPQCGQDYPEFTGDVVEFEAEDTPMSKE